MCCLPRMPSACGCIAGEHEDRSMLLVAFSRRMSWVSRERRRGGRLPGWGGVCSAGQVAPKPLGGGRDLHRKNTEVPAPVSPARSSAPRNMTPQTP